jgi:hypothetical protein
MNKDNNESIVIKKYTPEYLNGVSELRDSYRPDSKIKGSMIYNWELMDNTIGEPEAMIALDGEKVVAMVIAVLKEFYLSGEKTIVAEIQDGYTHQNYFRRGLFSKLAIALENNLIERNINLIYGIPNDNNYPIFVKKLGYTDPYKIRILFKILKTNNLLSKYIKTKWIRMILSPLLNTCLALSNIFIFQKKQDTISIDEVEQFPKEINTFCDSVQKEFDVILSRNNRYLNWRYIDSPRNYQCYVAKKGHDIVGYFVLSIVNDGRINKGYIIDFLTYKNSEMASIIFKAIAKIFKNNQVDIALVWMNDKAYFYKKLLKLLYFPSKKEKYFILKNSRADNEIDNLMSSNNASYFVVGDTDNM